jgi:hypothetical protein
MRNKYELFVPSGRKFKNGYLRIFGMIEIIRFQKYLNFEFISFLTVEQST